MTLTYIELTTDERKVNKQTAADKTCLNRM